MLAESDQVFGEVPHQETEDLDINVSNLTIEVPSCFLRIRSDNFFAHTSSRAEPCQAVVSR